jgi:hypothetical protein
VASGDGAVDVGSASGLVAVHAVITATSTTVARAHEQPRCGTKSREIISTTLPGRHDDGLSDVHSRRKCDKTTLFVLTHPRPSSYLAFALIGVNRGRGAGKGR